MKTKHVTVADVEEIKTPTEYDKLLMDAAKHLTTLNTASMLVYGTLVEKAIIARPSTEWIAFTFLSFFSSLIAVMMIMTVVLHRRRYWNSVILCWFLAQVMFLAGVSAIVFQFKPVEEKTPPVVASGVSS